MRLVKTNIRLNSLLPAITFFASLAFCSAFESFLALNYFDFAGFRTVNANREIDYNGW